MGKNRIAISILVISIIALILYNVFMQNNIVFGLSKYGSRGEEVKQIQTKLKRWGYYKGVIDGIYGSGTLSAVKAFQTSSSNSTNLNLLSRLVYGEARGEPYSGQVAVAAVVLNRVSSSSFPNTLSGVIYQSGAFDAVSDGQINMTPDSTAKKAAQDAINGWDPSYGAIYYFNPSTATNKWIWSRPVTVVIGKHRFCK